MKEIFKPIVEFDCMYEISNCGRIRSLKTNGMMIPQKNNSGYMHISISHKGKSKTYLLHRLVANAFIMNHEGKQQVNHKNGIKNDNRVDNLEWVTNQENVIHSFVVLGRKAKKNWLGKFGAQHSKSKKIICLNTGKTYECMTSAVDELGLVSSSISKVCRGQLNHTHGYIFKYA